MEIRPNKRNKKNKGRIDVKMFLEKRNKKKFIPCFVEMVFL